MIRSETFIDKENKYKPEFIPISDFNEKYDPSNIYIFIDLEINSKKFLNKYVCKYPFDHFEDFWHLLIDGIVKIENGNNEHKVIFSDITYKMNYNRTTIEISLPEKNNHKKKVVLNYKEFVLGVVYYSKKFYFELDRINFISLEYYNNYSYAIKNLEKKYGKFQIVKAETFILIENKITPINEVIKLDEIDFIEGSIRLEISYVELISEYTNDYINLLWCLLIDGIIEIETGSSEFNSSFPTLDIQIKYKMNDNKSTIEITIGNKKVKVYYQDFVIEIVKYAKVFFNQVNRINTLAEKKHENYLNTLEKLNKKYIYF